MTLVLAMGGCAKREPALETFYDLEGVPLSSDLRPYIEEGLVSLQIPEGTGSASAEVDAYCSLEVDIWRPAKRKEAGDKLYARWRSDPANFLWIELAARYNRLLRRQQERDEMYALPALSDTSQPVGAFVCGRRYFRHGSKGEYYLQAEHKKDQLDSLQQCWLTRKLAAVDSHSGDNLAAVKRLLDGLGLARTVGGFHMESFYWFDISHYLHLDDRLDDALHAAALSGALAERHGCDYCVLQGRTSVANILASRREYDEALGDLEECMEIALDLDFPWVFTRSADYAASLCSDLGQPERALAYDLAVLERTMAVADSMNVTHGLVTVADDYRREGRMDSCRVYLQRARVWAETFGHERTLALLPRFEAEYYCQIGNYATAESLLAQASESLSYASLAQDEAELLLGIVKQGLEMAQADVAYRAINRLRELRGVLTDSEPENNRLAEFEVATADFLARQGEFRLASEALARARTALDVEASVGLEWEYHRSAGELALLRGDVTSARRFFADCLDLAERGNRPEELARSRFHLGNIYLAESRFEEARELFSGQDSDTLFGGRFRTKISSLVFLGMTFAGEGRHREAVEYFERARRLCSQRSPEDLLARLEVELGASLAALGRARRAEASLVSARERVIGGSGLARISELATLTGDLRRDATEALIDLYCKSPDLVDRADLGRLTFQLAEEIRFGSDRTGSGGDHQDVLQRFRELPDAPVLAFFVGRSRSFAWLMAQGRVEIVRLPGRQDLIQALAPVLSDTENPARPVEGEAALRLSGLLLGSIVEYWPRDTALRIIPDDVLFAIPWSGLPLPAPDGAATGKLLLEHGPVIESPSLALLGEVERAPGTTARADRGLLLAVGVDSDPKMDGSGASPVALRNAEKEAERVAALWPAGKTRLRLGPDASWERIAAEGLDRFSVIHLATHAVVYQGLPMRSTLRFGGGDELQQLTIPEVGKLHLNADLIYLSCCEASRQLSGAGSGLMNFAGAFLQAGAKAVIASTLTVDDEASAYLADRFYHYWLGGASKATALRRAQLDVREHADRWQHPYFWAYYRLIGSDDSSLL